jgi:hypothetical protein
LRNALVISTTADEFDIAMLSPLDDALKLRQSRRDGPLRIARVVKEDPAGSTT